jgi:hypothetical protein
MLAIMPTLDDVDIAPVQRGDQSRSVVIPGPGGLGGAAGGHGHGGFPAGGGLVGSRSGASAGGRGVPPTVPAPWPSARSNRRASSLMTRRYRPTRMSLCRSGCGNFPAPDQRCAMRKL